MDLLTLVPWQGLGAGGIVTLIILFIIRGDIHTDREFKALEQDRDNWRNAYEEKDRALLTILDAARLVADRKSGDKEA